MVQAEVVTTITHAYLLVGPTGAVEDEGRRLAASIVADGDERALALALRGMHPDVVEFEPVARTYSVRDDVRDRILPEAHRSPVEGDRKVLLVRDAERLDDAANALLKTLEEPPARTHFVLTTDAPDELLETVRSRCRRVDVDRPSDAEVVATLVADGVSQAAAERAATLAGGRVDRARALAGRLAGVHDAFVTAASSLDGVGASVALHSARIGDAVQASIADLEAAQEAEAQELADELEASGYADRTVTAQRRRLADRQKRELRRARIEAWLEGITAIESVYRDALAPSSPRNTDREPVTVSAADAARAVDACRAAREAFEFNPNESLLVERLLLTLPAVR